MIQVIMGAMGCDRRAHYGNVEQPFCGKHGHCGQWPCLDAASIEAALTAAGFGLVADAKAEAWDRGMGDQLKLLKAGPGYEMGNPYRAGWEEYKP